MDETDVYLLVPKRLLSASIQFVVTGSVASIVYGEPRATMDVDLVVDLSESNLEMFVRQFPPSEFYVPPSEVLAHEVRNPSSAGFSLLHNESGFKADIFVAGGNELQRWAVEHARFVPVGEIALPVAPPEYVILKKLEYYHEGGSEKHVRDILSILRLFGDHIDFDFIDARVRGTDMKEPWDRLLSVGRREKE